VAAAETLRERLMLDDLSILGQLRSELLRVKQHPRVEVHLQPRDLGSVQVAVESRDGRLCAHFHATHGVMYGWLREHLPALASQLADSGLALSEWSLSTSGQPRGNQAGSAAPQWTAEGGPAVGGGDAPDLRPRGTVVSDSRLVDCFA